ncbi:MAG: aromatic ring-hydroxylating dioxygenase subunit alpha [Proteobacteria bacterium]|nr:aromatic ring-hydroxylating dioxygenase subunit alpha [Pseudomonadota bacterium]
MNDGFLRNAWYVIAWDHEIPADGLFARTVLGEPVLVYRTADGGLTALADRCCHRLAPLSAGRKEGDAVRCGYHGLKYGPDGRCIEVPGQDRVPPRARVRRYPLALKNRWVFVWMGDPERADPALLPDNFSCDHADWCYLPGYMHYQVPWLLIADNLLDFSHLSYVHDKTFGGTPEIARAQPLITEIERGLRIAREVRNVPPSPYYQSFRPFDTPINRWIVYDFVLPATLLMHSGGRPAADADDDLRRAVQLHSCQALTPETATSTHYFFQESHRADQGDAQTRQRIFDSLLTAFEEDRQMITAQARNLALDPAAPMLPLAMDAALVRFRRLLQQQLQAEAAAGAAGAAGAA